MSGPLLVGLDASVVGWTDVSGRMSQVETQTHAKWMRQDFFWSTIEPSKGTFSWTYYDNFVQTAAQDGIHLLPLLFDPPSWAASSDVSLPNNPADYATFVAQVVGRYGPHGTFWASHPSLASYAIQTFEIWNEPYYSNGNGGVYNPAAYAQLVKAAGAAGHAADPSAKFLMAVENEGQMVNSTWVWWIDALYQSVPDLNNYFDGVAVHPYGTDVTSPSPAPVVGQAYTGYEQVRRVEALRQEMVNHGASNKPLWVTEIGWPTCTSGSDRCTTQAGQAADLSAVFNLAKTTWSSYVQAVFVYAYDDAHANSTNPEDNYGLVLNNGGTPKQAFSVWQANNT